MYVRDSEDGGDSERVSRAAAARAAAARWTSTDPALSESTRPGGPGPSGSGRLCVRVKRPVAPPTRPLKTRTSPLTSAGRARRTPGPGAGGRRWVGRP